MKLLRPALRLFASSVDSPSFVNRSSDQSVGALLASRRTAELGGPIFDSIMSSSCGMKSSVCLVRPTMRLLTPSEADDLSEEERVKCIAVKGEDALAMPTDERLLAPPQISVTVPLRLTGTARSASLCVERVAEECIKLSTVSASGTRKHMTSGPIPASVLDRLFKHEQSAPVAASDLPPARSNHLPEYLRSAVASFLERRVRLQCLCTAAMPPPVSRPVCLDHAYLKDFKKEKKSWACIRATLHPSSAKCLCASHGLRFEWPGQVEVLLETCARPLEQSSTGTMVCPCHQEAVDAKGHARFQLDGHCTECTGITVSCIHREGRYMKRGVTVEMPELTDEDRHEVATILIAMCEYQGRTHRYYAHKDDDSMTAIARHVQLLSHGFTQKMQAVDRRQACTEDPVTRNPREMLKRDMVAVDLLRGGGVFRKTIRRGDRKGDTYIVRAKRTDDHKPLKPHETDLISTHGHLFRKDN